MENNDRFLCEICGADCKLLFRNRIREGWSCTNCRHRYQLEIKCQPRVIAFNRGLDSPITPVRKEFSSIQDAEKWLNDCEYTTICPCCQAVIGVN